MHKKLSLHYFDCSDISCIRLPLPIFLISQSRRNYRLKMPFLLLLVSHLGWINRSLLFKGGWIDSTDTTKPTGSISTHPGASWARQPPSWAPVWAAVPTPPSAPRWSVSTSPPPRRSPRSRRPQSSSPGGGWLKHSLQRCEMHMTLSFHVTPSTLAEKATKILKNSLFTQREDSSVQHDKNKKLQKKITLAVSDWDCNNHFSVFRCRMSKQINGLCIVYSHSLKISRLFIRNNERNLIQTDAMNWQCRQSAVSPWAGPMYMLADTICQYWPITEILASACMLSILANILLKFGLKKKHAWVEL